MILAYLPKKTFCEIVQNSPQNTKLLREQNKKSKSVKNTFHRYKFPLFVDVDATIAVEAAIAYPFGHAVGRERRVARRWRESFGSCPFHPHIPSTPILPIDAKGFAQLMH